MDKDKLIASASSLEKMVSIIKDYLYGSTVRLLDLEDGLWLVANAKGPIPTLVVELKKGRYKLVRLASPISDEILDTLQESAIQEGRARVKMLKGLHITSTEKKHIEYILDNDILEEYGEEPVLINKVKSYKFVEVDENVYEVTVGSYDTWTFGKGPYWDYSKVLIEFNP